MYMTSQILFSKTLNENEFKEKKMYMHIVCVCVPLPELNPYLLSRHMWLHYSNMLLCPDLRLKTASDSSWGGSHMSFLT